MYIVDWNGGSILCDYILNVYVCDYEYSTPLFSRIFKHGDRLLVAQWSTATIRINTSWPVVSGGTRFDSVSSSYLTLKSAKGSCKWCLGTSTEVCVLIGGRCTPKPDLVPWVGNNCNSNYHKNSRYPTILQSGHGIVWWNMHLSYRIFTHGEQILSSNSVI